MGWTIYSSDERVSDPQAECDKLYTWSNEVGAGRVLRSALVGNVYYAAVQVDKRASCASYVMAGVCLIQRAPFGYKDMTESVGPNEHNCPREILQLLSPLADPAGRDEWAAGWRAKAWARFGGEPRREAGRDRQLVELAAASPKRSAKPQDDIDGLALFDFARQPSLF